MIKRIYKNRSPLTKTISASIKLSVKCSVLLKNNLFENLIRDVREVQKYKEEEGKLSERKKYIFF